MNKKVSPIIYNGDKIKFFTDGIKTIKLKPGDEIPDGFYLGRTFNAKAWNKGLTKETDERVAKYVDASKCTRSNRTYIPWNKGLTKDTNESLKTASEKISLKRKGKPSWNKGLPASEERKKKQSASMMGKIPWNKGLTKEDNDSLMSTSNSLMGHKCFVEDWSKAKEKEYFTKKKNKSFNSSKIENKIINELISTYGEEDVIHPYRDERYPFNCDAYIVSKDLFIEVQGTIEHNGRPFDKNNKEHINEAKELMKKAQDKGPDSRYWNIYKWWTEIDPMKLSMLRKNNLNFQLIYPNGLIIDK